MYWKSHAHRRQDSGGIAGMCFRELKDWRACACSWEPSAELRVTERHLPYEISQCYLPSDAGERALPQP